MKNLLQHKKLILVLDLDHTLLNSTQLGHLTPEEEYLRSQTDSLEGTLSSHLYIVLLSKVTLIWCLLFFDMVFTVMPFPSCFCFHHCSFVFAVFLFLSFFYMYNMKQISIFPKP